MSEPTRAEVIQNLESIYGPHNIDHLPDGTVLVRHANGIMEVPSDSATPEFTDS